jgi:chromosomal replication initiation ATPase DnaA
MDDDTSIREITAPGSAKMDAIVAEVARVAAVPVAQIMSTSSNRKTARARQLAMWRGRQAGLTFGQIGQYLNRDHKTVMSGVRRIDQLIKDLK